MFFYIENIGGLFVPIENFRISREEGVPKIRKKLSPEGKLCYDENECNFYAIIKCRIKKMLIY